MISFTEVTKAAKFFCSAEDEDLQRYEEVLKGAEAEAQGEEGDREQAVPPGRDVEDDGRIVGLTIHRTDKLKTDFYVAHPLVRVHMVDVDTGNYLKKQRKSVKFDIVFSQTIIA